MQMFHTRKKRWAILATKNKIIQVDPILSQQNEKITSIHN